MSPGRKMSIVWQIRLALFALAAVAAGIELLGYSIPAGVIVCAAALSVFGFGGGLYLPAYFRRFGYSLSGGRLSTVRGAVTVRTTEFELSRATSCSVRSTPLMRLFRVRQAVLTYPGGRLSLPALSPEAAEELLREAERR